ncbi:MAG: hypothetical protein IH848_05310, partial [Acidobacteria bacterium]|nr:hypothetical protein [Acidobacteriota bacterium]
MIHAATRLLPAAVIATALFTGALLIGPFSVGQAPETLPDQSEPTPVQAEPPGGGENTPPLQATWFKLIALATTSGLLGGLFGELWRELLGWIRRRAEAKTRAKEIVHEHMDPILKSADELLGKLRSLAQEDFRDFRRLPPETSADLHSFVNLGSVFYLFANFWARLEILRKEGLYVNLNKDPRGKKLMQFLHCLESTRVRVVDRAWQRAIGECLIVSGKERHDCMHFRDFVECYLS